MEGLIILIIILIGGYFLFSNSDKVKINNNDAPARFEIEGRLLTCQHCRNNKFYAGRAQLNTPFASFLSFDFLNKQASFLSCSKCGYMHWFRRDPNFMRTWIKR
jgi:predicted nucleic-acid-binding Zn-ribbon protein